MRCFSFAFLLGVIGLTVAILCIGWVAEFFNVFNGIYIALLVCLSPLGVVAGCVFFSSDDDLGKFSLKKSMYILMGALFSAAGFYSGLIVVIRLLWIKQFGEMGTSFIDNILNPSSLPVLMENTSNGPHQVKPDFGWCVFGFSYGVFCTWWLFFFLWNTFGHKRLLAKKESSPCPCLICNEPGVIRIYEHRIFYTVGTISAGRSFLFHLPFCGPCWANMTTRRFWIMKVLIILGLIGATFATMALVQRSIVQDLFIIILLGNLVIAFILYKIVKRKENRHRHFRIDRVDERSNEVEFSIFDEKETEWRPGRFVPQANGENLQSG